MVSKVISAEFLFKNPLWIFITLLLSIVPHFAIDYESCYIDLKEINSDTSLLSFIRHVLIEKFFVALLLTVIIFIMLFLMNKLISKNSKALFKKQINKFLLLSVPFILLTYSIYWGLQFPLVKIFSIHHVNDNSNLFDRLDVGSLIHYSIISYLLISIIIYKSYYKNIINKLEVTTSKGKAMIDVEKIIWITKRGDICEISCDDTEYKTSLTISKLIEILNPDMFIQVNRASIVKIEAIKEYSYWENHKYILNVGNEMKQFVISRKRFLFIKEKLK